MPLVTIYHNITQDESGRHLGMIDGYKMGHALAPVARYNEFDGTKIGTVLENAFETFNVGEDYIAQKYRSAGNRSLSVGDVVGVLDGSNESFHAVARFGWNVVEKPSWFVYASAYGTKSIID